MNVTWKGGMAFEAVGDSGASFTMDSYPDFGGNNTGPTPVETLMGAMAACSAMDVVSILKKKRQEITGYRIEVSGDRNPPGEWPRPFKSFKVTHIIEGPNLDEAAVARAVELSDEKYCTVVTTLREKPEVVTEFRIEKS